MKKLALLFFITFTALAQRPMSFDDLAAFQRVGVPALSPDGKWIAYDLTTTDMAGILC